MNSMVKIIILALVATSTLVQGRLSTPSTTVTKVRRHLQQLSDSKEKLLEKQANKLINKDKRNNKIIRDLGLEGYGNRFNPVALLRDTEVDDEKDHVMRPSPEDMMKGP
jgi:predicted metal-dependent RNase